MNSFVSGFLCLSLRSILIGLAINGVLALIVFSSRFLNEKLIFFVLLTKAMNVGGFVSICVMYDILHTLFLGNLGGREMSACFMRLLSSGVAIFSLLVFFMR
jgi:hypothetical protein